MSNQALATSLAGKIVLSFFFVLFGFGLVVMGLKLTPEEHKKRPRLFEEGWISLTLTWLMPLPLARAFWIILGLACLAVPVLLILGFE
jgi:hypothetical protein